MASLPFPPQNPVTSPAKNCIKNPEFFTRIPTSLSLKPLSPSTQNPQFGRLENIHLISLSKQFKFNEAHEFLDAMDKSGVSVTADAFESLFKACWISKSLSSGRIFHYRLRREGQILKPSLGKYVIRMYFDAGGGFDDARKVFDEMSVKDLGTWSEMVSGCARNGLLVEAFGMFSEMTEAGIEFDVSLYSSLMRTVSFNSGLGFVKLLHSHGIRMGLIPDALIDPILVNMYVKCGCIGSARQVFDSIEEKNAVVWTDLMVGYVQSDQEDEALALFDRMIQKGGVELDGFVFSIALKACSGLEHLDFGRQIHGHVVKHGMDSDVSVGTPLVDFYIKCGSLEEARCAFEKISCPNEISWSSIIAGYSQTGKFEESIQMFNNLRSRGMISNPYIYTSVFQACSALADLNLGSQLHGDAIKRGLISDLFGESAIVTMYSKSGSLDYARRAFQLINQPDAIAWTAVISGCAYHGHAMEALKLFEMMLSTDVRPNSITFVSIFTACSHSGLVSEAQRYMDSMNKDYGVKPTIDHYNCMVDIYCRAGQLKEAFELIKSMPFEPDSMTWKILLAGCRTHQNVELGKIAGENLLQMTPKDTAAYVLMFSLYTSVKRWEEAANVRKVMIERDVRKEVSCSWITIKGKVHRFIVGDRHHPQTDEIYCKLEELNQSYTCNGFAHLLDDASDDLQEMRIQQLLNHSEKLAIAFGLVSTPRNVPIRVFNNLRICNDCHDFTKWVSKSTGHEVLVRDSCRFHHFKDGECSCRDYW